MLNLIRAELTQRDWRHFVLTGETEDRGALVTDFQNTEGSAVFLISLRAGGFGLNLTQRATSSCSIRGGIPRWRTRRSTGHTASAR
jgi:SNF2 family DNA or RNA helicase